MSASFIENAIILILTALITGFGAPFVLKKIDERRQFELAKAEEERRLREKRFEAELSRQAKIIDAQAQMLDNLSRLLWEWQFLYIALTYYYGVSDRELYQTALKQYDEKVMSIMVGIRAEISRSLRLVPRKTYLELEALFHKLYEIDGMMRPLIEKKARGEPEDQSNRMAWSQLNQHVVWTFSKVVDQTINDVAIELQLNVKDSAETKAPS